MTAPSPGDAVGPAREVRRRVAAATALAVVSALATVAGLVFFPALSLWGRMALLVVAALPLAALLASPSLAAALARRTIVLLAAATLIASAVVAPRTSGDIAPYAFWGRVLAHYETSPYQTTAARFPRDPVARRVAPRWQHTRSPYGPGFTAISALGMGVVGTSEAGARALFQGLAVAAALAVLLVLVRRGAPAIAIAAFGLHPTTAAIVNGGNNDLLIGLAALGAVVLALRRKPVAAGAVAAAGALVKAGGLFPLMGIAMWVAWRYGRRAATQLALTAAAVLTVAYVAAGGRAALEPLRDATRQWSRAALWNAPRDWLQDLVTFHGPTIRGVNPDAAALTSRIATVIVVLVTVLVLVGLRRRLDAAQASVIGPLVYLLGAAYTLPRYAGWALPSAALSWRSWPARMLFGAAALLQLLYLRPPGVVAGPGVKFLTVMDDTIVPALAALAILALLVLALASRRRLAPAVTSLPRR